MPVSWEADSAQPGGPCSMDVLMRWLSKPGNRKCWQSTKTAAVKEVAAKLRALGITRSIDSVSKKIIRLESQYESTKRWLQQSGQLENLSQGNASRAVQDEVKLRCPRYHELTSIFQYNKVSASHEEQLKAPKVTSGGGKISNVRPHGKERLKKHQLSAQGRRKKPTDQSEQITNSRASKRHKSTGFQPASLVSNHILDLRPASILLNKAPADIHQQETALENITQGETTRSMDQNCLQSEAEVEHRLALAKCQLDGERERQELHTKYVKMILRQNLLSAGIPKKDVDREILL
ncbi:hypothetical protein PHYBOEH_006259 [Phytophthora boehmeriae]|uniref:Uncharacterized protein n=1 Tax=Phytophthora boehmeriae TaxID=109152 RepID=A0A8T1X9A0_9STRA|nr:hypothetical protein PHYBOEH_006259 [Phytophthora boehmeriae]